MNVFNVWPLFGPVAGGTYVTVTGKGLNVSDPVVALFPADDVSYDVIHLNPPSESRLVTAVPVGLGLSYIHCLFVFANKIHLNDVSRRCFKFS